MTIQSPSHRLRLFILSLSLFGFASAAGAGATQTVAQPETPPGITISNAKVETFTAVTSEHGSVVDKPGSNPNRLPLPTDGSAVRIERTELFAYSMQLNAGPKPIKAIAWDFVFTDPISKGELTRHSLANLQSIGANQKKVVRFTTRLSSPKVVSAGALEKNKTAPFGQRVMILCLMFADGSTWEKPNAIAKPCDRLRRWIEERKKYRPSLEDLPYNP